MADLVQGGKLFSFTDNDEIAKQCCKIAFTYHSWHKKQAIYVIIHLVYQKGKINLDSTEARDSE